MKRFLFPVIISLLIIIGIVWYTISRETAEQPTPEQPSPEVVAEEPYVDPFPDDQDRDGIPDAEEAALGTDTKQFDTDGDGLSDKDELDIWNTDPTLVDTDGDGFNDGWEVIQGYSPTGDGQLNT